MTSSICGSVSQFTTFVIPEQIKLAHLAGFLDQLECVRAESGAETTRLKQPNHIQWWLSAASARQSPVPQPVQARKSGQQTLPSLQYRASAQRNATLASCDSQFHVANIIKESTEMDIRKAESRIAPHTTEKGHMAATPVVIGPL